MKHHFDVGLLIWLRRIFETIWRRKERVVCGESEEIARAVARNMQAAGGKIKVRRIWVNDREVPLPANLGPGKVQVRRDFIVEEDDA